MAGHAKSPIGSQTNSSNSSVFNERYDHFYAEAVGLLIMTQKTQTQSTDT